MIRQAALGRARLWILGVLLCLSCAAGAAQRIDDVVLVAGRSSPVTEISESDLRRVFVGVAPRSAPRDTRAVFNATDPDTIAVFLRSCLFMTSFHYERLLLTRRYSDGQRPVTRADSYAEVARRLRSDNRLLSFIPRRRLGDFEDLKEVPMK